jgi:hypothetical protein
MENKPIIINPTCNNERVIQDLSDAYKIAMQVPFQSNISNYFLEIFTLLNKEMKDTEFLRDAECFSIYKLFEKILKDSGNFTFTENLSERTLAMSSPGYVYQIELFTLFASYHYLTVVIGPEQEYVDIYQSYGSTMRLHHKKLNLKEFEKCIRILSNIKRRGKNFFKDANKMLYVESLLYGISLIDYITILYSHLKNNDEPPLEYSPEEIAKYQSLGFSDTEFGESLKTQYELGEPIIKINEYKPIQSAESIQSTEPVQSAESIQSAGRKTKNRKRGIRKSLKIRK